MKILTYYHADEVRKLLIGSQTHHYLGSTICHKWNTSDKMWNNVNWDSHHVEGRHGVLFTTNCLLLAGKTSPSCLGSSICVSGEFV